MSLNRLRGQPSPTQHTFPHPLSNSSLAATANGLKHMRSGSLHLNGTDGPSAGSPQASPVNSPTRLRQETEESIVSSATASSSNAGMRLPGLSYSTSLRRKKSYNAGQNAAPAAADQAHASPAPSPLPTSLPLSAQQNSTEPPTPTGGSGNYPQVPTSSAGDTTPLPILPSAGSQSSTLMNGQSSSTSASQIMNENLRPATAQAFSTSPSASSSVARRPATAAESSGSSHKEEKASSSSRAGSAIDNPYKSFRVTLDDPCYKVLPAALKKYKINDDWRQYALFICYGSNGTVQVL